MKTIHTSFFRSNARISSRNMLWTAIACISVIISSACYGQSSTDQKLVHRLSLSIGNTSYTKPWNPLVSPVHDAEGIWKILGDAGFDNENEYLIRNGNGRELRAALEDFGLKVRQLRKDILKRQAQSTEAIVVVAFFSGHGFIVNDTSYFAGIDATGKYVEDVVEQSVGLNQLVRDLTPSDRDVDFLSVLLIDACRSSIPLPSRAGKSSKGMNTPEGNPFRKIRGAGRIAVFATTDGNASYDGRMSTEYSVFTAAIVDAASAPTPPSSFTEFVNRIERNTPRLAKARFNVEQWPEVYRTGVTNEFFYSTSQTNAAAFAAEKSNSKGIGEIKAKATGWIWLGDYGRAAGESTKTWIVPRFISGSGNQRPAPSEISAGSQITIQANLNVRDKFPIKDASCEKSKKYQECAQLLGTIPKGLKVIAVGESKSIGLQNWTKIEFDRDALYSAAGAK